MQTSCSPYFMFGAVYCLLQEVSRPKSKAKAHVNAKATPTVSGLYWCLLHVSYDDIDTATCQQQQEQQ